MITMKIKSKYLCLILFPLLFSCDKKLDLSPENNLVEAQLLEDRSTTDRLIAGGYYTQFLIERDVLPIADLSTGNLYLAVNEYYDGSLDPTSSLLSKIWSEHYKIINIANVVVNNLRTYAKFDEQSQKQLIAEAKFLRAYSYFRLVSLFGDSWHMTNGKEKLGVPLRLEPFTRLDASQIVPRSTNKQIFDQILLDLTEAIPDLPTQFATDVKQRSRATDIVAKAFLTRVYLYLEQYDKVIEHADMVLSNTTYQLASSADLIFPNNSNIIALPASIPFNKEIVYGYPVSWNSALASNTANNFQYTVEVSFLNTFAVNDIRATTMIRTLAPTTTFPNGEKRSNKFTSPNMYDNMMIIRLVEVVLSKAEALAQTTGVNQVSIDLLNQVRQRAFKEGNKPTPYTMSSFANKQALIDAILQERKWELAFEGHDRFDQIRTGRAINAVIPLDKYALPIPQNEIDISNGILIQNHGY